MAVVPPDPTDGDLDPFEPQIGSVFITEFMADPVAAADPAFGDWIELFNATSITLDIEGWTLSDADGDFVVIESGVGQLLIPPGGRVVLTQAVSPFVTGGVTTVALPLTNFSLDSTADEIILRDASGKLQHRVVYDTAAGWPVCSGSSVCLTPSAPQFVSASDDPVNWCCTTASFCSPFLAPGPGCPPGQGAGDPSTPGDPNICP